MQNRQEARLKDLYALSYILDDYNTFINNLDEYSSLKNHFLDEIYRLYRVSQNKFGIGSRKAKKFYQQNKKVIDTINGFRDNDIYDFIKLNYQINGTLGFNLYYFHKYFMDHKDEIEKIRSLLFKLRTLGFHDLIFAENADFTKEEYSIRTDFLYNFDIKYLDNIEIIPNYNNEIVKYKSNGSNYKIIVKPSHCKNEISNYERAIILNSLIFDLDRLPTVINKESIFDTIINLKEKQKDNCSIVEDSVNLDVCIYKIQRELEKASKTFEALKTLEDKEKLRNVLLQMRACINQLQTVSNEYDDNIVKENDSITKEILEQEKQLYFTLNNIESRK